MARQTRSGIEVRVIAISVRNLNRIEIADSYHFFFASRLSRRTMRVVEINVCQKLLIYYVSREDMYAQDSIDLLQNSGLQFRKHEEDGIEPLEFAELLMSSG